MFQKSYMFEHTYRFGILQRKIHSVELQSVIILVSFVRFVSSCIFSVKLRLWQTVNTRVRLLYSAIFNDSASLANLRADKTPISNKRPPSEYNNVISYSLPLRNSLHQITAEATKCFCRGAASRPMRPYLCHSWSGNIDQSVVSECLLSCCLHSMLSTCWLAVVKKTATLNTHHR